MKKGADHSTQEHNLTSMKINSKFKTKRGNQEIRDCIQIRFIIKTYQDLTPTSQNVQQIKN